MKTGLTLEIWAVIEDNTNLNTISFTDAATKANITVIEKMTKEDARFTVKEIDYSAGIHVYTFIKCWLNN